MPHRSKLTNEEVLLIIKKAEQGNGQAQYNLGNLYLQGNNLEKSIETAFYWFEKSAEQGHIEAQYNLALIYEKGFEDIILQNYPKAIYLFKLAANQGYSKAQNNLGYMYDNGYGVAQNYSKAVYWYEKSAKQGDPVAQFNLGNMYNHGFGVPQNFKLAYAWISVASVIEHKYIEDREEIAENLSQHYLIEAQDLALRYFEAYSKKFD